MEAAVANVEPTRWNMPLRGDGWMAVKSDIEELYITRDLPLTEVMEQMKRRGFDAT